MAVLNGYSTIKGDGLQIINVAHLSSQKLNGPL